MDGAFDPQTGLGGWGLAAYSGDQLIHTSREGAAGSSNNSIEIIAVVNALRWIEADATRHVAVINTDSRHVVEGCHRWRPIWRSNGWKRVNRNPHARRRPIPDAGLWCQLDALLQQHDLVTIDWCRGHSGSVGNELAHQLASEALRLSGSTKDHDQEACPVHGRFRMRS